ncbi:MAG: sulfatase [Polyangiaceae bacterium]|nr:sulfatase [Polyangiaceae bacterium]
MNVKTRVANEARPLGAPRAELLAWAAVGVVHVIGAHVTSRPGWPSTSVRIARGAYALGHALALGLVSYLLVVAWTRARHALGPRLSRRAALAADLAGVTAAAYALAFPVLGDDLLDLSARIGEDRDLSPALVRAGLVLAVATGIPAVAGIGRLCARPWLRWLAVLAALGLAGWNHALLTTDYPGAHLYLAWAAAVLGGAALATLPVAAPCAPGPALRAALAAAALLGAWSVLDRPRDTVLLAMLEERGSTLAPFLARARATLAPAPEVQVPADLAPWFADRSGAPEVPPTPASRPGAPIVILYMIDSLRADVIESGKYDRDLPEFARLQREGVHFTTARSPGTGTSFTLSALFMGKYYSEQYWTLKPGTDSVYPWSDGSLRFTDVLTRHGVRAVALVSRKFMLEEYGIARGFDENEFIPPPGGRGRSPTGRQLGAASIMKLGKHGREGPLFLWIHNMDAHAPFNMAGTHGTLQERYVREVAIVDREIGILRERIRQWGWADRTTLIVSSDHGEGFFEHGTSGHSMSLYEELLRIPLLVVGPGVRPRAIDTPVSLIDAGPTILDLFGLPTPGSFLGQSLVPVLRGEDAKLTRPICAETRLKQSIVLPDGLKIIRDLRRGTREIYDLAQDPGELRNLVDEPGADREAQMGLLAAFFDAHTLKRPGYEPPYRTW